MHRSCTDNSFKFAGGFLAATGLYHYGQRWYDPRTDRWTQEDPLNDPLSYEQANRYAYAAGNPINYVDVTGRSGSTAGCEIGPLSVSGSRDDARGSSSGLNVGLSLGAGLGCSGSRYRGNTGKGISIGGHACLIGCVGINSDSGLSVGLGVDVSVGVDVQLNF